MTKLWHELWERSRKAEMEGQDLRECLGRTEDQVARSVAEILARHYRQGAACKSETSSSASHASVDCRDWRMTVFPMLIQNGQVRAVNCLFHEVRDQKGAEEEIRPILGEAEMSERSFSQEQACLLQDAKLASIAELATGVAHELNNPLNNIGLFAGNLIERLEAGSSTAADLIPALRSIMEQVQKGSQIVNALRTFAGQSPWPQTPVNLNSLVESSVLLLTQQFVAHNIVLQMQLSKDELIVQGDPIQLQRVVTNLLINARDAVVSTPTKIITIVTSKHLEYARVAIQDTGIGLPFDVHGAQWPYRIWCETTPEEGSTFFVEFPLVRDD